MKGKLNTRTAIGILAVFTLTLSMAVLLPARADSIPPPGTPPTQFSVSGPAADQIQYQIFGSESGEFSALQAGSIDLTDTPLNPSNVPTFCPSTGTGANFWCTGVAPNPPDPEFGFQHNDINLANNFWGITFCFAQDNVGTAAGETSACQPRNGAVTVPGYPYTTATCPNVPSPHTGDCAFAGIQWRQGFAALLNKQGLVANVFGGAAQALDNLGTVPAQGVQHSGLPFDAFCAPNPPGPPPAGCVGSYTAGTNTLNGVCSWDSLHTTTVLTNCTSAFNYPGTNPSTDGITWDAGSTNFCNAADHFIAAGIASGKDVNCRLTTLLGPGGDVVAAIRSDSGNRLASGNAQFNRFCDLLNAPISAGQCSRTTSTGGTLRLVNHPLTITDAFTFVFSGSSTNGVTTNTPNLDWNMYTGANSGGPAFNQQWSFYDSAFASTICGGTSAVPASPTGDFPVPNYVYACNVNMDSAQEAVENSVTFAGAANSLQTAMDVFGSHTINNPTVSRTQQFGYAKGWTGVSDATGIGIATGNAFSLMNAWNPSPAIGGPTIRWGMKQGTSSLNPFEFATPYESNVLQEIYDPLLAFAPYIPGTGAQIIGWMANSYLLVNHSTDATCPASIGTSSVQGCVKMLLRGDNFFQDGVQVTASDVKFSFENFKVTGGIVSPFTANTVDVVYDPSVLPTTLGGTESTGLPELLYIALASANAFALLDITRVPIVPQHIWTTIGASGPCVAKGTAQCTVEPTYLSGPGADPVANNRLIGSGPFVCASGPYNAPGTVLGGGCTSTGTSSVTTGSITLFRYGQGVSHLSGNYFRNNAKYKEFAWADTSGIMGTVDVLDLSAISGCFSNPAGATCAHYRSPDTTLTCTTAGPCIGTVSGGSGGALTGLQKAELAQWYGTSWTSPFAYGGLDGVIPAPPQLQEDGSMYS